MTEPLAAGAAVELPAGPAHHLRTVLRLGPGDAVAAFNARRRMAVPDRRKRPHPARPDRRAPAAAARAEPDLWLLFAPIKRARLDWLVEKATELGVAALRPVWTRRTQVERLNLDRLRAHAVAAAEQSERLSVPELRPPQALGDLIEAWPPDRRLVLCDETGGGEPIAAVAARARPRPDAPC